MAVVETIKEVAKLVQQINNMELYQKILELQVQIRELLDENHASKRRIRELEEGQSIQESLEFRHNMYWRRTASGEEGPFCSGCWDAHRKLMRLLTLKNGVLSCPGCSRGVPGSMRQ